MVVYLFPMLITAITETIVLWCCRYRGWKVLSYFFVLNLISNFLVNFTYRQVYGLWPKIILVPSLELGVYVFEVALLGLMTGYNKKLFWSVLLSNVVTYTLGVILYGF